MELSPTTVSHYVEHAYAGMRRVLARLDDDTVNVRPQGWATNSVAGLVVHCCELAPSWFETPGLGSETVPPEATHGVDVAEHLDTGIASLACHRTYLENLDEQADPDASAVQPRGAGARLGVELAVTFEMRTP